MDEIEKKKTNTKQKNKKKQSIKPEKKSINKVKEKSLEPSPINTRVITTNNKKEDLIKTKKKKVLVALIAVLTLILLVFLINKTFFRKVYKTTNFEISIPFFSYFVSDKDNVITFKSLRKSDYLNQYFDEYLSNLQEFDYYICGNDKTFYYNEEHNLMILDINVEKFFALKTIKVFYDIRPIERVCL